MFETLVFANQESDVPGELLQASRRRRSTVVVLTARTFSDRLRGCYVSSSPTVIECGPTFGDWYGHALRNVAIAQAHTPAA